MNSEIWRTVLVSGLVVNAVAGLGYRVFRLTRGGPIADVWGQGLLAGLLAATAALVAGGVDWARWIALAYALVFGLIVMPVWVLGVWLPLSPRAPDYAFTIVYWAALVAIAVAAIAL